MFWTWPPRAFYCVSKTVIFTSGLQWTHAEIFKQAWIEPEEHCKSSSCSFDMGSKQTVHSFSTDYNLLHVGMILYWRIPVGSPHVSSRNVIVHNVNILILANIYPLLEGRLFLSLSHHFKQIQMNVLSCLRKGNDQSGLYPMTTSGSIWHTTNSIWM